MITATFKLGGEQQSVKIEGNNLLFLDNSSGMVSPIEGIRLSHVGVLKEHPDLEENDDWRNIAIERLKEHVKKLNTEMEKINYVKDELTKFGYEPLFFQRAGFRVRRFE